MEAPNLVERLYEQTKLSIQQFACYTVRASSIGDPCSRRLVYEITNWQDKALHDVRLERIFEEGRLQEQAVLRELLDAGVAVLHQQQSFSYEGITGHVDGALLLQGEDGPQAVPLEIKSMSSHIWETVFFRGPAVYEWPEVADGFQGKPWLRRYYAQCQIYALGKNAEMCILFCKSKQNGGLAQVNIPLDWDYAEGLLQKAKAVHAHVTAGTLPERIPFDMEYCPECPFEHICLPDVIGKDPILFLEDAEVVRLLETREATSVPRAQYEAADEKVKAWAKARPEDRLCIGDWFLQKRAMKSGVRVEISRLQQAQTGTEAA